MIMNHLSRRKERKEKDSRRGVVMPTAIVMLPVMLAFVAMAVDTGKIAYERSKLQNACDAAALAASQEIRAYVADAGDDEDPIIQIGAFSPATDAARAMAVSVAEANGVGIDGQTNVTFGHRHYDEYTGGWEIVWGMEPYNVVRVSIDREESLPFGSAIGVPAARLLASATAFIECRDIVVVMDFSASMNDDSELRSVGTFGVEAIKGNLEEILNALEVPDLGSLPLEPEYMQIEGDDPISGAYPKIYVTFKGNEIFVESSKDLSNVVVQTSSSVYKFDDLNMGTSGTFQSPDRRTITSCWIKSGSNDSGDGPGYGERFDFNYYVFLEHYGLDSIPYPYPGGSWYNFYSYACSDYDPKRIDWDFKFGKLMFPAYLMDMKPEYSKTTALWKTPHYPFHSIKEGCSLFLEFLGGLEFGDEVGLVSYDQESRVEQVLDTDDAYVNVSSNPISNEYEAVNTIQTHKQAGHYDLYTNIGAGLSTARSLINSNARFGAKRTILLMTDGQANRVSSGFDDIDSAIDGFSWADYTDFDDDGFADYETSNEASQSTIYQAILARNEGTIVHTMSVGSGADVGLMEAVAKITGGIHINVPGGTTIGDMREQLLEAFSNIAANVPPPRLIHADAE